MSPHRYGSHVERHPEAGEIDVEWVMTYFAGHERNHLPQIERVAADAQTA